LNINDPKLKFLGVGNDNIIGEKHILQNLLEHVVIQDKSHKILWANKAATKSIKLKLEDIIGKNCYEVWAHRGSLCPNCPVEAAIKSEKSQIGQKTTYDGRGWLIKGYPIKNINEDIIGAIEYTINITEWANLEKELLSKTKLMHKITETSPVAITVLDLDGEIIFSNKRAEDILGLNKDEVLSRSYNSEEWHITDFDGNPFPDEELPFRRILKTKKSVFSVQHCIQNSFGEKKYLSINASPLFNEENELINIVTTMEDISEQIRTKTKLKKSERSYREAYDQINLYKDIFAHDINNILQNISTSMELLGIYLDNSQSYDNFEGIIKIIEKQVVRGANLSTNVNVLSNLDENMDILTSVGIIKYLKKSIKKIKNSIKYNQNVEILFNEGDHELYIKGNKLIENLFDNILINSILHNNDDLITIHINTSQKTIGNKDFIIIAFIDNGIGFNENFKAEIFKKSQKYNRFEGIGLGFMLIKKIVEGFGGKMEIKNRIEHDHTQGTKILLKFPATHN